MSDKPLHVRVAEALGCTTLWHEGHGWWLCDCDTNEHVSPDELDVDGILIGAPVLREYDNDWSATGPLMEKYRIDLTTSATDWIATAWRPDPSPERAYRKHGETPLIAVCNLILALKAAGKLATE